MMRRERLYGAVILIMAILCAQSVSAQQLLIASPKEGTSVTAGQVITVDVLASPGAFRAVQLISNTGSISSQITSPPYEFRMTIPAGTIGPVTLTALGISGPDQGITSAPVTLSAAPNVAIRALQTDVHYLVFRFVGQQGSVLIHGAFQDGENIDLPRTSVSYVSADNSVAIITSEGLITAVGPGATTVTIAYQGQTTQVKVSVPKLIRGDFTGDGVIDQSDLAEIQAALNQPAAKPNDARDLNGDGKIDALDARIEATLCTHPRCALQ